MIKKNEHQITIQHGDSIYQLPLDVVEKYRVSEDLVTPDDLFAEINKKYTKPGALLKGLRVREGLTQLKMAKKLNMAQSDVSQMENGTRRIGREVAKRIGELFDFDYRSFLE